jgi:hypothetical protein
MSEERRGSVFLTLSPEIQKTYNPETADAASRASSFASSDASGKVLDATKTDLATTGSAMAEVAQKSQRSDSSSSSGSARRRFLKLNPVRHHVDEKESDFVEVEEE